MTETIFYTLPCIVCFLWSVIYAFRKRSNSQNYYWVMLIVGIFYFLTYAFYVSPKTNYKLMVHLDVACQPFAIFLLAMLVFYIESHLERPLLPTFIRHLLFLPPLFHLGFVSIVYYLLTFEEAASLTEAYDKVSMVGGDPFDYMPEMMSTKVHRLYLFFDVLLYSGICAFYSFIILSMCVYSSIVHRESFRNIPQFFTKKNYEGMVHLVNISVALIILFIGPLVALGRSFFFNHPYMGASMSFFVATFIFFGAYVEFVGDSYFPQTILNDLKNKGLFGAVTEDGHGERYVVSAAEESTGVVGEKSSTAADEASASSNDTGGHDATNNEEAGTETAEFQSVIQSSILTEKSVSSSEILVFNENIDRQFIYSMEVERVYTDPSLTIDSLAQKLKTNRSTLSALVNKKYGMTFKTMLATYRIAFAKQYMLENPNISVDDVAEVSGFGDRSSFFHKFKEVTGMSPKVWLTKQ